jgi:hypothetical protein
MHKRFHILFLAALVLGATSATAQAQSIYAGLLGGYASTTEKHESVESYGVALGASAGVTLPVLPIYLGARAIWFLGDTGTVQALELNRRYTLYGIDLGYDAILGPIVLRPSLGIGSATLRNSIKSSGLTVSSNDSSLYFAPGVGLIVKLALIYVGAELRYNALTESKQFNSVSMLASLGLTI